MRYQQRQEIESDTFESRNEPWKPWLSLADDSAIRIDPQPGDSYVVIDEMADESVRLVWAPWPDIDWGGRLYFVERESQDQEVSLEARLLRPVIDRERARQNQVVRELRIGDTFLVRAPVSHPADWDFVLDVTQAAREAAKRALFRAVAPPPHGKATPPATLRPVVPPPDRTERRTIETEKVGPAGFPAPTLPEEPEPRRARSPGSEAPPAV